MEWPESRDLIANVDAFPFQPGSRNKQEHLSPGPKQNEFNNKLAKYGVIKAQGCHQDTSDASKTTKG